jgi:hypothetical protein
MLYVIRLEVLKKISEAVRIADESAKNWTRYLWNKSVGIYRGARLWGHWASKVLSASFRNDVL